MTAYDFNAPRLYLDAPLRTGEAAALDRGQTNYLVNVLRLKEGGRVLVFNGRDGEWLAELRPVGRKDVSLAFLEQTRPQPETPDLVYCFAPLTHARLDYMVQKAVEMGAGSLRPVFTRRTQAVRVNAERMHANAVEAAEQCGILTIPEIVEGVPLSKALASLEEDRLLVFCDEDAPISDPVAALSDFRGNIRRIAVLIGPEGGFTDEERAEILRREPCVHLSLGPRILRADTAAVAALTVVQSCLGDWV